MTLKNNPIAAPNNINKKEVARDGKIKPIIAKIKETTIVITITINKYRKNLKDLKMQVIVVLILISDQIYH